MQSMKCAIFINKIFWSTGIKFNLIRQKLMNDKISFNKICRIMLQSLNFAPVLQQIC